MSDSTKRVLLRRAVDAVGHAKLAARLGCPVLHVKAWLAGAAPMPDRAFLVLVDLFDPTVDQ